MSGREQLFKQGYLTEAEMEDIRRYLLLQDATVMWSDTRLHSFGRHDTVGKTEVWASELGHYLWFEYASPNPVGPQQNGWRILIDCSQCPEWVLRKVGRYVDTQRICFEGFGTPPGPVPEFDDLGNPFVARAIEALQADFRAFCAEIGVSAA